MKNESGIYPSGNRVLIFADQIEDKLKDSVIELLADTIEANQTANASGTLVAVGPDAWSHTTRTVYRIIDGSMRPIEVHKTGYSKPFAKVGERISFAKFAGQKYTGKDGKRYLVIQDEDVTCRLDDEVELSDLKIRKGAGLE